jgi:hypothetical protein
VLLLLLRLSNDDERCHTSVHWVYDSYEIGSAIGQALPQLGKTWLFITADYVFGRALQEGATAFIEKNGGKVIAPCAIRLAPAISPRSCCRRRPRRPTWSRSPMAATTHQRGQDRARIRHHRKAESGAVRLGLIAGNPRHQPATRARHDVCVVYEWQGTTEGDTLSTGKARGPCIPMAMSAIVVDTG